MRPPSVLAAAAVLLAVAAGCDTGDGRSLRPPTSEERAGVPTTTTSTTAAPSLPADVGIGAGSSTTAASVAPFALTVPWGAGGTVDVAATCDGGNLSPLLSWSAPPAGTVELALLVTDDDAAGYVHWAVSGIAPTAGEKAQGAPFSGAFEGVNDAGTVGWSGPCPPPGPPHTYRFMLYALTQQAELPEGFTGADLRAIAVPAAAGLAEATGTYTRAS